VGGYAFDGVVVHGVVARRIIGVLGDYFLDERD
jgi:hypothetical protein